MTTPTSETGKGRFVIPGHCLSYRVTFSDFTSSVDLGVVLSVEANSAGQLLLGMVRMMELTEPIRPYNN
jgi:hypothetical protein